MKNTKKALLVLTTTNFIWLFISTKLFLEINNLFIEKPKFIQETYSHDISKTKTAFKKSVREEFSTGISEIELIKELSTYGFKPGWSYGNQHEAIFVSSNIACSSVWSIRWKVDEHNVVTEVNGQYKAGCL